MAYTTTPATRPGAGQERADPTRWIAGLLAGVVAGAGCVLATAVLDIPTEVLAGAGAWLPAAGLLAGALADRAAPQAAPVGSATPGRSAVADREGRVGGTY